MKLTPNMTIFRCSDKFDVLAIVFFFFCPPVLLAFALDHSSRLLNNHISSHAILWLLYSIFNF